MARLNIERQKQLEPKRMKKALDELTKLGFYPEKVNDSTIAFEFKKSTIKYFPYSGWASGKTIKDGRRLNNLLKQLK